MSSDSADFKTLMTEVIQREGKKALDMPINPDRVITRVITPVRELLLECLRTPAGRTLKIAFPELQPIIGEIFGESVGDLQCQIDATAAPTKPATQEELRRGVDALRAINLVPNNTDGKNVTSVDLAQKVAEAMSNADFDDGIYKIVASAVAEEAAEAAFPASEETEPDDDQRSIFMSLAMVYVKKMFNVLVEKIRTRTDESEEENV